MMSEDRIKETADMIEEKDGTIREDGEAVIDETEQFEDFLEEGAEELVEGEDAGDEERPDTRRIKVLQGRYMAEDAAWIIGKKSKDIRVTNVNVLFYPYSKILYKIDMGEKLQRLNDKVLCMLDLYTGRLSFATKPGKFSYVPVEEKYIMPVKIDKAAAMKDIPLDIGGEVMRRKKVLKIPDIILDKEEVVYKPFYIVECENKEEEHFHILFDPLNAHYSLINA